MRLRIAILIEGRPKQKLIALSKRLDEQSKSRIILGNEALPHITLYNASFPNGAVKKIRSEMEDIIAKLPPFSISITKEVDVKDGYMALNVRDSGVLYNLHKEMLKRLSPLRDKNVKINPAIPKTRRELIKRYGTSNAGKAYNPHITIGLIDPVEMSKGKKALAKTPKLIYRVKEIALCKSPQSHISVRGVIARFNLADK